MFGWIKPTVPAIVGLFLGLALATWIKPDTNGGFALLIVLCVLAGVAIGAILSRKS